MLIETVFLLLFIAVSSIEIPKSYSFDTNFFEDFDGRFCDGDLPWLLTEYETLGIPPLVENRTRCIQASSKCCATSNAVDFTVGAIELNVYLKLLLNESGLTVTIFDENSVPLLNYEYNKFTHDYTEGWNTFSLNLEDDAVVYINLKGRTGSGEIILVDSIQNVQYYNNMQNELLKINTDSKNLLTRMLETKNKLIGSSSSEFQFKDLETATSRTNWKKRFKRSSMITEKTETDALSEYFDSNQKTNTNTDENISNPDKTAVSETTELTESESDQEENKNESTTPIPPSTNTEQHNQNTTTEQTQHSTTDNPPTTATDRSSSKDNFWSPLTIALVAFGALTFFVLIIVAAYHCGKIRARMEKDDPNEFIIDEDAKPDITIPRVKGTIYEA